MKRDLTRSSVLDSLFPDPTRHGRGKVARIRLLSANGLTPRQKLEGIVKRVPEVMIKFDKASIRSGKHLKFALSYITRDGELNMKDQNNQSFFGNAGVQAMLDNWSLQSSIPYYERLNDRQTYARRIILSMPAGTPDEPFKKAVEKWGTICLEGYDYVVAFHTPSNDPGTKQPHAHFVVRSLGHDGRRLHFSNAERDKLREVFATCLREVGVAANATPRWARGKTQRGLSQAEYNNVKRARTAKERAKLYAMQKKRAKAKPVRVTKNLKNRSDEVQVAIKTGKPIPDAPGIVKAKARRQSLTSLLEQSIAELQAGDSADKQLAAATKKHLEELPPVESAQQMAVRVLSKTKSTTKEKKNEGQER